MRPHIVLLAGLLTCGLVSGARADLQISGGKPMFSSEDILVITRNRTLLALIATDAMLVRQALDAIASSANTGSREARPPAKGRTLGEQPRDPDLDDLARSSPEASHDLIVLIKKATAGKK